jgi:hypothetical protein
MGRSCVASSGAVGSVSGGAEEGDCEEEGEGEAIFGGCGWKFSFVSVVVWVGFALEAQDEWP